GQLEDLAHSVDGGLGEERLAGRQQHERRGHQEGHHQVEDRGQAQREREALDLADGEEVDDHGTDEGDHVAGDDGALRTVPTVLGGGTEGTALADLILDALVEHDEGVGGGADTDDQAGDAGQVQRVTDPAAQQDEGTVNQQTRGEQGHQGDDAEEAVVGEHEDRHQDDADDTGDQAGLQGGNTQGRGEDRKRTRLNSSHV